MLWVGIELGLFSWKEDKWWKIELLSGLSVFVFLLFELIDGRLFVGIYG